jgi:hypothetical protein
MKQADKSAEGPRQANGNYLEHQHSETTRQIFQTIHASALNQFTFFMVDAWWDQLGVVVYQLERLPEDAFKELMEVIQGLGEARNELRDACFLFDVEEINPVHRLVMRNRAVVRGEYILQKILLVWPLSS